MVDTKQYRRMTVEVGSLHVFRSVIDKLIPSSNLTPWKWNKQTDWACISACFVCNGLHYIHIYSEVPVCLVSLGSFPWAEEQNKATLQTEIWPVKLTKLITETRQSH